MKRPLESAQQVRAWGGWPLPIRDREKGPEIEEWQYLRLEASPQHFYNNGTRQNVGCLLGEPYGLTDSDLDCPEAISIWPMFAPDTGVVFGRKSARASHWFYYADPAQASIAFADPLVRGKTLLEIRCLKKDGSIGLQTVVPWSRHKDTGELIEFEPGKDNTPANVEWDELKRAASLTAAAALFARHWPAKGRHHCMLALAGVLYRAEWLEDAAKVFCRALYRAVATHDPAQITRSDGEVHSTYEKLATDRAATGIPTLREHLDKKVIDTVLRWLDIHTSRTSAPVKSPRSPEWRDLLIRNITKEKGKLVRGGPKAILANAITALRCAPEWDGVLAYNEFSLYTVTQQKALWQKSGGANWTDFDDSRAAEWLQHQGILVSSKLAGEAVQTVAMESAFHPVRDYLAGLKWDGKPRLDRWLVDYLAVSDSAYVRAVGSRWMISAIARVYRPGCQADYTLLLEGDQGIQKSTALRTLARDQWFTDHISDISSKDARIELHGVWIMELAELAKIRTTVSDKVKSFLTARVDHFRQPYGRRSEYIPRQCVFAGSVNDSTPFTDETGNRRFWPVHCGNDIKVDALAEVRDQLWAEAYHRYRDGAVWYLDTTELNRAAEGEQEQRYAPGVWDEVILAWLDNPIQRIDSFGHPIEPFDSTKEQTSVTDILIHAIGKQVDKLDQRDLNQVSRCLIHHRWRRRNLGPRGSRKYFYQRPPEGF